jgi:hypothetical protein
MLRMKATNKSFVTFTCTERQRGAINFVESLCKNLIENRSFNGKNAWNLVKSYNGIKYQVDKAERGLGGGLKGLRTP